jgi:hypothetical protein
MCPRIVRAGLPTRYCFRRRLGDDLVILVIRARHIIDLKVLGTFALRTIAVVDEAGVLQGLDGGQLV